MSEPTTTQVLRDVAFFRDIAEEHLERLAKIGRPVEFAERSEVFHEFDKAEEVYVLLSGRVSLIICQPRVGCRQLMEVGDGDLIGWSPLVGRPRLYDTARTLTPTKAIALNGEQVLALCHDDPVFGFEFMRRVAITLAERLSATRLKLLEISGVHLPDVQPESD